MYDISVYDVYIKTLKESMKSLTDLVIHLDKGPFIFYEVGGGWWDLGGGHAKKRLKRGAIPKKRREGGSREIF